MRLTLATAIALALVTAAPQAPAQTAAAQAQGVTTQLPRGVTPTHYAVEITPHAKDFGYGIIEMGSTAFLAGSLGRTMSPVAGAAIVCAGLARISPIEITKRNGPGCIVAAIAVMVILL